MKKIAFTALVTVALVSIGSVFAQSADQHEVEITIPQLLVLQIVDAAGNVVADPTVVFDIDPTAYLTVAEGPTATEFVPTSSNFTDVRVLTNNAAWSVDLAASALTFTPVVAGNASAGLGLADIRVVDSGGVTMFALDASGDIASGPATTGWQSLGFGGSSFRLDLDGDEEPGTYTWTITYTVSAP